MDEKNASAPRIPAIRLGPWLALRATIVACAIVALWLLGGTYAAAAAIGILFVGLTIGFVSDPPCCADVTVVSPSGDVMLFGLAALVAETVLAFQTVSVLWAFVLGGTAVLTLLVTATAAIILAAQVQDMALSPSSWVRPSALYEFRLTRELGLFPCFSALLLVLLFTVMFFQTISIGTSVACSLICALICLLVFRCHEYQPKELWGCDVDPNIRAS